ncbi:hypothetical protein PaeCFBP13512_16925 [Paenibacillus sp. CFBP13512]|uniref:hypothetical protein n=1 Tax=Paenibacillus sp. CFBP13512 TaxID=2184007 RepID=UPI0010C15031|nr:hypothetical protein [Paenibacillus sp. CFBP13512]TKJ88911.1 hypothetical protein PaeCFBP13512_16925 [Paenibacillus sp. CFBP13512]
MKSTKLIMVEGLMGAGKTSTASFIQKYLEQQHIQASVFLEGDLDHPVDFESVACLNEDEYRSLLQQFEHDKECIQQMVHSQESNYFFFYQKAKQILNDAFPDDLYTYIATYDIYELPLARHCELLLQSWKDFVDRVADKDEVVVLECCFFQNPMCMLLAKSNADQAVITQYILELADIIKPLQPVLIYLYQEDISTTLHRVSAERSSEWLDFVIRYYTEQEYGKAYQLSGVEGLIKCLQVRRRLELEILEQLHIDKVLIDNSELNREQTEQELIDYLNK